MTINKGQEPIVFNEENTVFSTNDAGKTGSQHADKLS